MVVAAQSDPSALASLCQSYWQPVFDYVLSQRRTFDDALDLTQEFFARLIAKKYSAQAYRERGRFRSFLLASVKHFLLSEDRDARAQKRGGGCEILALDVRTAEGTYQLDPGDDMTPDKIFERRWAFTVMDRALQGLQGQKYFAELKPFLTGGASPGVTYSKLAAEWGVSEGVVKIRVHRMRRRYGELLRNEIAQTVETVDQVDEELRYLLGVLSGQ
jgi:RNA polymerase sigma factor (sigma-70 family)